MPIEEILSRRLSEGFAIILSPTPTGQWRAQVREGTGPLTSLRAAHPGFSTPLEAVTDTDQRLGELLAARSQAKATDTLAALERLVTEDRLVKREVPTPTGPNTVVWVVMDERGVEIGEGPTVGAAARVEATRVRERVTRVTGRP